jgi:DNA-binding CsgD family transcriptional regulator/tetratricopeptide (TPR) repeat protein
VTALPLLGRERELSLLEAWLELVGERGGALLVRGEAGAGKSAVLDATRSVALDRGLEVLTTAGFQSEACVAFAGLQRLLLPVLGAVDGLPAPQRTALESAFGLHEHAAPDFFLIALASLNLLSQAATDTPLLLVIEDAEWLDVATCDVMMFLARRVELEPILMLFAIRDGSHARIERAGLAEVELGPLDEVSAALLLDTYAPDLSSTARRQILAEADGNPLALQELPRVVSSGRDQIADSPMPLTQRLEGAFASRISDLPLAVRTLLLVAALDDGGDQEQILGAASMLVGEDVGMPEVAAAQAARAITVHGDGLRFCHPLVRSAVYQGSLAPQRRAAHEALASAYGRDAADRGLWHRAASLQGVDDNVGAELEAVAERALRRGDASVAVAALERASHLVTDDVECGRLLLRAALIAYDRGQFDASTRLVRDAHRLPLGVRELATLRYLLEVGHDKAWSGAAGIRALVDIAGQLQEVGESDRALDAVETASFRCWWEVPDQETRDLVVVAAHRLSVADGDPRMLAILAQADPATGACDVIRRISHLTPDATDPVGMYLIGSAASAVWAYDLGLAFLNAAVVGLRGQGRLGLLAQALVSQAWAAVHLAREPLAVTAAEEGIALSRETGQAQWAVAGQLAKATIAAERGEFAVAEALAREAEAVIVPMGATPMLALVQFVRGRGAVAHQQYAEGLEHLRRSLDPADPAYHPVIGAWGLSDLVEAAAHLGLADLARAYLVKLEALAAQTSGPLLLATAGYARPMVASDDDAQALYEQALGDHLINWPCYRGRMLLWHGRWLRRQRRVAESRTVLQAASDGFDALAFPTLADSARQELRASGVVHIARTPDAWALLTPQELQIAQLASAGHTNRAIGQQLYLSPRTVQSHLYRIFPKLGITARSQLRDLFIEAESA